MISIICIQMAIVIIWLLIRYTMFHSDNFLFNFNEIHHGDFCLFSIVSPMWFELQYPILAWIFIILPWLLKLDDIIQHRLQKKYNNPKYNSPLKTITRPLWEWIY